MRRHRFVPLAAVLLWSLSAGGLGPGLAQEEESPLISGADQRTFLAANQTTYPGASYG